VRKELSHTEHTGHAEKTFCFGRQVGFRESCGVQLNFLSSKIIQTAINVHKEVGPGLLESVYQACMLKELRDMELKVQAELPVPVVYRGELMSHEGFRIDLMVEDRVVVELKSVEAVQPVHKKQLLTYLRLTNKELGLLINFGEVLLKKGIHRIINSRRPLSVSPADSSDPEGIEGERA
jgi:GxxExxY protein